MSPTPLGERPNVTGISRPAFQDQLEMWFEAAFGVVPRLTHMELGLETPRNGSQRLEWSLRD